MPTSQTSTVGLIFANAASASAAEPKLVTLAPRSSSTVGAPAHRVRHQRLTHARLPALEEKAPLLNGSLQLDGCAASPPPAAGQSTQAGARKTWRPCLRPDWQPESSRRAVQRAAYRSPVPTRGRHMPVWSNCPSARIAQRHAEDMWEECRCRCR